MNKILLTCAIVSLAMTTACANNDQGQEAEPTAVGAKKINYKGIVEAREGYTLTFKDGAIYEVEKATGKRTFLKKAREDKPKPKPSPFPAPQS